MRERNIRKDRVCRTCQETFNMTADGIKTHALVCEFEKRTGLTVIQHSDGSLVVDDGGRNVGRIEL